MDNGKKSNQMADNKNPAFPRKPLHEYMMFMKIFGNELVEKTGKKVDIS